MKKILIIIFTFLAGSASAQSYFEILQKFIAKSPQLKALDATVTADSLAMRRGLNPVDPSVELEYFFDNSFELSLRQQFDFPTLYHQRNMIAKRGIDKAKLNHKIEIRNLLLQVSDLYQQYVYYCDMINLLESRAKSMKTLDSMSSIALAKGHITALEHKKSAIMSRTTQNELNNAINELSNITLSFEQLGVQLGGKVEFEQFDFKGSKAEFVQIAMEREFGVEMLKIDSIIAAHEIKLAKQEWIPKLEVGYKGEFESGKIRSAIVAGISIPLWQNRNNVKHTKASAKAVSANLTSISGQIKVQLSDLFDDYETARENCKIWESKDLENYQELVDKSLSAKNITSMEYLFELTSWLDVQLSILNDKYQYALNGGRIAIYLSID